MTRRLRSIVESGMLSCLIGLLLSLSLQLAEWVGSLGTHREIGQCARPSPLGRVGRARYACLAFLPLPPLARMLVYARYPSLPCLDTLTLAYPKRDTLPA